MSHASTTQVVAGIIRDASGRILVSRRRPGSHLENLWEFPGGKLDPGEDHARGLAREIEEELGIRVRESRPLASVAHDYPEKTVRLWLREVGEYSGTPEGREGQALRWVEMDQLRHLDMPAADRPVVRMLNQDPRYAISADPAESGTDGKFVAAWRSCLERGARLLRIRMRGRPVPGAQKLLEQCAELAAGYGARWLFSGTAEEARALGADGIHLTARALLEAKSRPVPESLLLGASCHNHHEIRQAGAIGADFITLSPVAATASHPHATPLGWARFAKLVAGSPVPVYALGGVRRSDLELARRHGAFGVAGIRGFGWPG